MAQFNFLKSRAAMILSVFLIVQGSVFYGFSRGETPPSYRPLEGFPKAIMVFFGNFRKLDADVIKHGLYFLDGFSPYVPNYLAFGRNVLFQVQKVHF